MVKMNSKSLQVLFSYPDLQLMIIKILKTTENTNNLIALCKKLNEAEDKYQDIVIMYQLILSPNITN